ncbi:MAG: alpha-ribazole phosphatase [Methylotenera sp.]|uniref:alpha-ribazole phosphatase n=1 Tax=Methylotenera sp. TaxID=2051956 RepID=UPI0018487D57|nr:alpha-ribazole phosphatase [Methylotenera sp.]NOU24453.1 alpha-ribazole phosphatase [Methylotenera sp.]
MKLTLVRHTSLDIAPSICYGQSDVGVSANFDNERLALQNKLAAFQFDAIYASPLKRCHQLAQALCIDKTLGYPSENIKLDERLRELHFGDWEMHAWDAIPRDIFDVWANDYANLAPPNGETFSQLHARAKRFVEDVSSHYHGKSILVVTHGGLIRALVAEVLNMPLKRLFRINIDHASVTQLEFNGEVPKINFMNL